MELFNLRASITLDTSDYEDGIKAAKQGAISFADVFKGNVLSQVVIGGIQELGTQIKGMSGEFIQASAEVKAETSQFQQTFKEFQSVAEEAIGSVADESGILETRLNTLGSQIFAFARSSGGEVDVSMTLMQQALQAAADSAAYYDKSLEDTTATLQSFLKGNFENDAALGLSATETTRNAAAMELFGKEFKELTEIQKQKTLLQMVLDAQALSGAMGQASREADGWENVQGNLNESLRQFQANVGTPFLENLIPIINNVTAAFQEWNENVDWAAFSENVNGFFELVSSNGPEIISVISAIGAGFVTWNVVTMIQGVVSAIQTFKAANEGLKLSQLAVNAVMNANPIALVISLLASAAAAVITLYKTSEDFRNKVNEVWGNVKTVISDVVDDLVVFFTETVPNAGSEMISFFKSIPGMALEWGQDLIDNFVSGIKAKWNDLKDAVTNIAQTVQDFIGFSEPDKGPLSNFHTYAPDMMDLFSRGIEENAWKVQRSLDKSLNFDYGTASLDFASSGLGISSAGIVNGVSSAMAGNRGGGYTMILQLPDNTELARYYLPGFIDVAKANGTPIANPVTA